MSNTIVLQPRSDVQISVCLCNGIRRYFLAHSSQPKLSSAHVILLPRVSSVCYPWPCKVYVAELVHIQYINRNYLMLGVSRGGRACGTSRRPMVLMRAAANLAASGMAVWQCN